MTLPGILWLVGMGFVFVGEQIVGDGFGRWALDAVGTLLAVGSLALRAQPLPNSDASLQRGRMIGLVAGIVASASLLLYALSTSEITSAIGLFDEAAERWQGVWASLAPIVLLIGALPMLSMDALVAANPTILPRGSVQKAWMSGLTAALAISLVFPLNYLANHYNKEWDTAYFRTSRPGEATRNLVASLTRPVEVSLFFPTGNDVLEELRPYFREVEDVSGGMLRVSVRDQALDVALAEELKIQDNGWVVFREEGEAVKFKLRLEKDKAKRDLKQLDSLVHKNLLKATRGQRVAYWVVGHGEATHRTTEGGDWRKLAQVRKVLQNQSYRIEDLGLIQGLAEQVPSDADLVILAAPTDPLAQEEVQSLKTWLAGGGRMLVLVDSRSDALTPLLSHLGLERQPGAIADPKNRYPGQSPYLIVTNRYGTHSIVGTFNKADQPVVLPAPVGLEEISQVATKRTPLLRTFGTAYADANADGRQGEDEVAKVHNLAYAIEGGTTEAPWRAVVIGNLGFASDAAVNQGWLVGPQILIESTRWLAGDEDLGGDTASEEDVKIDHSPKGQRWWFWGTIIAVPILVLVAGMSWIFARRRMQ
jgi:hypothetical protein